MNSNHSKSLILLNGEPLSPQKLKNILKDYQLFICTDGAANHLVEFGITPNIIIGDLDSVSGTLETLFPSTKIIHSPCQYSTDFEKALQYAYDNNFFDITVAGYKGGRFDHAFSNMHFIAKNLSRFLFSLIDDEGQGVILSNEIQSQLAPRLDCRLKVNAGDQISLIPFMQAESVKTNNLKYPLHKESLVWGKVCSQSNEATADEIEVEIGSGNLIVYCNQFNQPDGNI